MLSSSQNQTPSQRQPFGPISGNSVNRPNVSGYGMSAGLKVGRQQGSGMSPSALGVKGLLLTLGCVQLRILVC